MRLSTVLATALAVSFAGTSVSAQVPQGEFAARRAALAESLPDGVLLVLGAGEPVPDYVAFHQNPDFNYLTGFLEPEAALVIIRRGASRAELLFVRPRDPGREVWNGVRLGIAGVRERFALEGRDIATLRSVLDSLLSTATMLHVIADLDGDRRAQTGDAQFVAALQAAHPAVELRDARPNLERFRGRKSQAELERLRIAAEISARGHVAVMRAVQPGIAEFELQALAEYTWRREGGDGPSYGSIVGSGPNSTTLHYNHNDRVARAGEVIVMDMATYFDGYAADITRTVPVNGRFSPEQRAIYTIVLEAQKAAERQVRPGGPGRAMSDSSRQMLAAGLAALGLIESPAATYDCGTIERPRTCPQLSLFYMHGLGHGIGLEVHDPEQFTTIGRIEVGSAFTIEPGIYVRRDVLDVIPDTPRNRQLKAALGAVVARYADIGIRIEDDYLVTEQGVLRPSAGVPREIDDVERELALPRLPRDQTVVERYLRYKTGR